MEFNDFKKMFQTHFEKMVKNLEPLFLTDVDRNDLWEKYLNSFPEGYNKVYKERREFDCNSCKQFIRPYANIVKIDDKNEFVSIWDISNLETPFKEVAETMSSYIKSQFIKNVFIAKVQKLGINKNRQILEDKSIVTWEHFYCELPKSYVNNDSKSIESIQGNFRDSKNVFKRSMDELTVNAGKIILELIDQKSLYRGEEFKSIIEQFIRYKIEYDKLSNNKKDNWCWKNSVDNPINRIRNKAIGTLLVDLSKDIDVDTAVTKFEKVMAPTNYKRPKAIFTKKMVEDAENKIKELGYENSLQRRFAQLSDITVNNLLFVNRDVKGNLKNFNVFDELKEVANVVDSKKFNRTEEIHIEDFIKNILPTTTNIELMIENKHNGNFISLIAPENKDALTMFKWNNNFSWSYNGDITDSIKQNVKNAGGNVEGIIRFSIQWNVNEYNPNDFDAHCKEPNGNEIFFGNCKKPNIAPTTGQLDVDIVHPSKNIPAVENITWTDINKMLEGKYRFFVHNFSHRGGTTGFSAEIEYDGQIYSYEYNKELRQGENVLVAEIEFDKNTGIKFLKSMDSTVSSKQIWNIDTNKFSQVNVFMYSPNYWDKQKEIGNKHYFFFLDKCKNESTPRGFFNEFLKEDLMQYKKVFEALGSKMRVKESDNQLSGIGFSSTQRNSILAKVEGSVSRVIKIIF